MNQKKPREIVIVFPFNTKTKELLIVQEYIHHYDRSFWKFVSGGIDKEEKSLLEHAEEELAEEIAMSSKNTYHFHSMEKIFGNRGTHFFISEDPIVLKNPPENPDADIITETRWINEETFNLMLNEKELLWDEATMAALMMFRKYK